MSLRRTLVIHALLVVATAGCSGGDVGSGGSGGGGSGGSGGAPAIPGLLSIAVAPADQTLVIDGNTPASATYTATGTFGDGHQEDITARVSFRLGDPGLGTFAAARFTSASDRGGRTTVIADAGSIEGLAALALQLRQRATDPASTNLPADPASGFGGAVDPARAPQLVYPNDGVLLPPNLGRLEIHFRPGTSNTLFELHFANALTDVTVYLRCANPLGGGCIYQPTATVWNWVAETNRGGDPVTLSLRGTDDAGSAVGVAQGDLHVSFSQDNLLGAIYYWTTSNGTAIMRYDFAGTQTQPQRFLDGTSTNGDCIGCHSLSRDGKRVAATTVGGYDGRVLLYDVERLAAMVPFGQPGKSVFESWNPDDSQYVGVYAATGASTFNPVVFAGSTGVQLGIIDVGASDAQPTSHPDWSPDGRRIVYVRVGQRWGTSGTLARFYEGAIEMVSDMGGGVWSTPRVLVARQTDQNHYYPTFSPDGSLIVYNESSCSGSLSDRCNAYEDIAAELRALAIDAQNAQPVVMARANAPGIEDHGNTELINSYPRWSPFVFHRTSEVSSTLEWITFSSGRQYGLRPPPAGGGENPVGTFLWMAAIEPNRLLAGGDPSYPAFAVPFQDLGTSNHIAQWTTRIVPPVQ
jgi:Tol biopolymer transport system component